MSLIAQTAQEDPATRSRKAKKTEILEVFSREPSKKVMPKTIKKSPAINTSLAANFRHILDIIP